jgi:hypothetical protein
MTNTLIYPYDIIFGQYFYSSGKSWIHFQGGWERARYHPWEMGTL